MSIDIEITPELMKQFVSEMSSHLDTLERMLLLLEEEPGNQEAINSAFRAIHSIKGNSDYVGLADVNRIAHELETLLDDFRSRRVAVSQDGLSLIFECLDLLRRVSYDIRSGRYEETDVSDLVRRLSEARETVESKIAQTNGQEFSDSLREVFQRSALQHIENIRLTLNRIVNGGSAAGAKASILRTLQMFRTSANYIGDDEVLGVLDPVLEEVESAGYLGRNIARRLLNRIEEIERSLGDQTSKPSPTKMKPEVTGLEDNSLIDSIRDLGGEIRVSAEKIDELANRVSELIIAANTLNYIVESADENSDERLRNVAKNISNVVEDLRMSIFRMGLVRISVLFDRLPRLVRELARRSYKRVKLQIYGSDTEADRKVIEHLVDPLVHIVRNAVDHGIEPVDLRKQAGKPETGTITISAYQKSGHIVVDVSDDGAGIDPEKIKEVALEKGVISQEQADKMDAEEIMNLIFLPGYTTQKEATAMSGRGVGLDVVMNHVRRVGGNITLSSQPGEGTRFRLQVPVSMTTMDAVLIESDGGKYAIPLSSVIETIRVDKNDLRIIEGQEVIGYRDNVLSVRHISTILDTRVSAGFISGEFGDKLDIMVIASGEQQCGIVTDRILGQSRILVKPLSRELAGIKEFSGAALLGDGSIVLILDPTAVLGSV